MPLNLVLCYILYMLMRGAFGILKKTHTIRFSMKIFLLCQELCETF